MAIRRPASATQADQAPAPAPELVEPAVDVTGYIRDAAHDIEVAGLLQDQPDLRSAQMTTTEWDLKLIDYLRSPRP